MISGLFRCISCSAGIRLKFDWNQFPLCELCDQALVACPKLCNACGSPYCCAQVDQICSRPWVAQRRGSAIHSYSALYHMVDPCYRVLKKWKTSRGPLFDRRVLKPNSTLLAVWKEFQPEAIVPIPQLFSRAWMMGGSRTERIAEWVSHETQLPVSLALRSSIAHKRQAELNFQDRLQSHSRFIVDFFWNAQSDLPQNVLLVDDFMTSGRTLFQAASLLRAAGVRRVHAFCLGVRARRFLR